MESVIIAKKATDLLKTEEVVRVDELAGMLFEADEQKEAFEAFRQNYEEEYGQFEEEVNVVPKATIRKPMIRMNVLRLGNDFEVKVLNPEADMEKGVDEARDKEFYTLYF